MFQVSHWLLCSSNREYRAALPLLGSAGKALTDGASLGAGAISFTYTLTSSVDASPIPDADVWVTSDEAGTNVLCVLMHGLRRKLAAFGLGEVIQTVRDVGYRMADPEGATKHVQG